MSSIFRPTVIRYYDKQGKRCKKSTLGSKARREKSDTLRGRYRDVDGKERTVSLGTDRETAELKLGELVRRMKRERAGDIDPFEDHRKRPLAEHLEDFELGSVTNWTTEKQAGQVASRCRKIIKACRFLKLADLSAELLSNVVDEVS